MRTCGPRSPLTDWTLKEASWSLKRPCDWTYAFFIHGFVNILKKKIILICKRRNKRKHTTHPCRQNGLLSTLINCKSLTRVFCTCFSLNVSLPRKHQFDSDVFHLCVASVEGGSWRFLSRSHPQLCNLPRLFCISWCLGPNVLLASTFPLILR